MTDTKLTVRPVIPLVNAYDVPIETRVANGIVTTSRMTIVARDEVQACELALDNMEKFLNASGNNGFEHCPLLDGVTLIAKDVLARREVIDL